MSFKSFSKTHGAPPKPAAGKESPPAVKAAEPGKEATPKVPPAAPAKS